MQKQNQSWLQTLLTLGTLIGMAIALDDSHDSMIENSTAQHAAIMERVIGVEHEQEFADKWLERAGWSKEQQQSFRDDLADASTHSVPRLGK